MTVKLKAETKEYIWGGTNLKSKWGFSSDNGSDKIAEAWSLSFHKDGMGIISEPDSLKGKTVLQALPRQTWGKACDKFEEFPVLIKFIDSGDNLSVQVHPSDEYARANEGQFGKTEMWYVVDSCEGAGLYIGFKKALTAQEYAERIANGTLSEVLNFVKVNKGESYFIPSGTVHAIGKGCTILEVQQNSNVTYRVFDYNRVGADGKPRDLHIEKAKAVSDLSVYKQPAFGKGIVATCKYFTTEIRKDSFDVFNANSFTAITVTSGSGEIGGMSAKAGETFFVPAGEKCAARLTCATCLVTYVSEEN